MNLTRIALATLLAGAAAAGAGCANPDPAAGYTMVSQYRPGIRTVAVPIWDRGPHEFRRDIEIRIAEALVKHIEATTPYKVVGAARADTLLTGTLKEVEQRVLTYDPRTGTAREIQIRFVCDFTWKDLRTGQVLVAREDFKVATEYVPESPLSEDFFQGSEDAANKLARRVVEHFARPW